MRVCVWCCLMSLGVIAGCLQEKRAPEVVYIEDEKAGDSAVAEPEASGSSAAADTVSRNEATPATIASEPKQPPKPLLSEEKLAEGWIQLFDGVSLFGWVPNNAVNWSVEEGTISADTGEPGLLVTYVPFADFELICDFWLEKDGNSGVFLRTPAKPTDPGVDCYELNICDTHPQGFNTASFVKRQKPTKEIVGTEAWKTFHVRAVGANIVVKLDGDEVLNFTDVTDKPLRSGLIGLQMNKGKVRFRNLFLKPLGTESLFNGADLSGWRVVPGSQSEFTVKDGGIHIVNGRGFLETEKTWKNFMLQVEAKTNGDKLNSGIFFRATPGTEAAPSNGYELQIQNGFKNGDRSQPDDFGTGAIFRRQKARWVVSNDREWTYLTLIADGPRFASWVNGLPVTTWTDDRKSHENPREGQRLDAGHLSLQGHDPTTDLDFQNLCVAPLP